MEEGSNHDLQGEVKTKLDSEGRSEPRIPTPPTTEAEQSSVTALVEWSKLDSLLTSLDLSSLQFGRSPWVLICRTNFDFVLKSGDPDAEDPFVAQTMLVNLKTLLVTLKAFSTTLSRCDESNLNMSSSIII